MKNKTLPSNNNMQRSLFIGPNNYMKTSSKSDLNSNKPNKLLLRVIGNPQNANQFEEEKNENAKYQNPYERENADNNFLKTEIMTPRFISEQLPQLNDDINLLGSTINNSKTNSNLDNVNQRTNPEKEEPQEMKIDNSKSFSPSFSNNYISTNEMTTKGKSSADFSLDPSGNNRLLGNDMNYLNQGIRSYFLTNEGQIPNFANEISNNSYRPKSFLKKVNNLNMERNNLAMLNQYPQILVEKRQSFESSSIQKSFKNEIYSNINTEGHSNSQINIQNSFKSKLGCIVKQNFFSPIVPSINTNFDNNVFSPGRIYYNDIGEMERKYQKASNNISQSKDNNASNILLIPNQNFLDKNKRYSTMIRIPPNIIIEQRTPSQN